MTVFRLGVGKNLIDRPPNRLLGRHRRLGIERISYRRPCQGRFERRLAVEAATGNMKEMAEEEIEATAPSLGAKYQRPRPAIGSNRQKHPDERRWRERTRLS